MTIFLCVVAGLVWISYVSARERGVPWFSLGGRKSAPVQRLQLRTHSIKPKSPWVQPSAASSEKKKAGRQRSPRKDPSITPLYYRLNELTHDAGASERLVSALVERNPDKGTRWCIEKAIYDIERDRMAR